MSDKTVTVQIGNTDDKLSQVRWSHFIRDLYTAVKQLKLDIHFAGGSDNTSPWQNYCIVANVDHNFAIYNGWDGAQNFIEEAVVPSLQDLCKMYDQSSIALTVGDTQFVEVGEMSKKDKSRMKEKLNDEDHARLAVLELFDELERMLASKQLQLPELEALVGFARGDIQTLSRRIIKEE